MDFDKKIIVPEKYQSIYASKNAFIAESEDAFHFLDAKGNIIKGATYSDVKLLKDDLYIVSNDHGEKYGLFNASTKENILPQIYSSIKIINNEYDSDKEYLSLIIEVDENYYNNKEGLADLNGNILIETKYSNIYFIRKEIAVYTDFDSNYGLFSLKSKHNTGIKYYDYDTSDNNDLIIAKTIDGKYGLLDHSLKYVLAADSDYIYENGPFYVSEKGDKAALYNMLTRKTSPYTYDEINDFTKLINSTGAIVKYNGKYGMIRENASFSIPPIYDTLSSFDDGYSVMSKDGLYGLIDEYGKVLVEAKYDDLYNFSNGFAIFKENNKYGYLNKSGNIAIQPIYDSVSGFDENGYASVVFNEKSGIIKRDGKYTIEPKYAEIYKLKDTLIVIEDFTTGLYGIADLSGKVIIDTDCNDIGYFGNNESTYIKINSQYALINDKAEIITTFIFDYIGEFYNSFAEIEIGDKSGYINTRGEYILE